MSLKHKGDQRGWGRSGRRGKEPFSLSSGIVSLLSPFLSSYLLLAASALSLSSSLLWPHSHSQSLFSFFILANIHSEMVAPPLFLNLPCCNHSPALPLCPQTLSGALFFPPSLSFHLTLSIQKRHARVFVSVGSESTTRLHLSVNTVCAVRPSRFPRGSSHTRVSRLRGLYLYQTTVADIVAIATAGEDH